MDRDERFMQGYRYAIKAAVTYVHAEADRMNHPPAKAALNVVATGLGFHLRKPNPAPFKDEREEWEITRDMCS